VLSIRMRRTGARKNPHFRVVVADSSNSPDGAFIEILGHYHPRFEPARITLDLEAVQGWIDKGAQPSDTVRTLLKQIERGELAMAEEETEGPGAAPEEAAEDTPEAEAAGEDDATAEDRSAADDEVASEDEPAAVEAASGDPAEEEDAETAGPDPGTAGEEADEKKSGD